MQHGSSPPIIPPLSLDVISSDPIPYICPGSSSPVSRAVHLARINAAWPGCDQCNWRDDSEGLAGQTVIRSRQIRQQRSAGICRTEFGVRGQYINRLDRRLARRLTQAFCEFFASGHTVHLNSVSSSEVQPQQVPVSSVVAGFDARSSSPDIFVGVISAIREFGLDIIDIGRSTAASLSEAVRSYPVAAGGVFVTGADLPPSFTGIDAFDRQGDPVPVAWQNHGFDLTAETVTSPPAELASADSAANQASARSAETRPSLMLTDRAETGGGLAHRRMSRRGGSHQVASFEDCYRSWLKRWYPRQPAARVVVHCSDPLIRERVRWLAEKTELDAVSRSSPAGADPAGTTCHVMITEDDRVFRIGDGRGRFWSEVELADRLNRLLRHQPSHVTAHADEGSCRFWLTDAGRPASGFPTEQIRDALATLGLLLKLTAGTGALPPGSVRG